MQESLRDLITQFAGNHGLNSFEALKEYYTPTQRQKDIIEHASMKKGSFEVGWADAFVSDKLGEATTHWRKLEERVQRGVGNPCPLLLIGIPKQVIRM